MTHSSNTPQYRPLRVLISGGGTGGHIFPALSIAEALMTLCPQTQIQFVGAAGRMEMERVPAAGYPIEGLPVKGFDRRHVWRNASVLVHLWRSMRKARRIVRHFAPDIAVGVGGYASGPTLKAAQRRGVPTLLQEQNSYAGVTNKLLAARAASICTAYEGMERFFPADRILLTGNPVRAALTRPSTVTRREAKEALGFSGDRPLLVVVGGSLGARSINEAVAANCRAILDAGVDILWQTGKLYYDQYKGLQTAAGAPGAKMLVQPFLADMATVYRAADLMVARAGAGTISELQILGIPAILIPSPNVAEDHQRKNAMALVDKDAAVMIPDDEASRRLGTEVTALVHDAERLTSLGRNVKGMALPDAAMTIAREIYRIINKK